MEKLLNIKIDELSYMKSDCYMRTGNILLFLSAVGYTNLITASTKRLASKKSKDYNGYASNFGRILLSESGYDIVTNRDNNTDITHLIACVKDKITINSDGGEFYKIIGIGKTEEEANGIIFKKLIQHSSVPILEEWEHYLMDKLSVEMAKAITHSISKENSLIGKVLVTSKNRVKDYIQQGLVNKQINIAGTNNESLIMKNVSGINDYLSSFGEVLAEKIQSSFKPMFTPGEEQYNKYTNYADDYIFHENGIELYEAQKATIEAVSRNLNRKDTTFVIGEMGSGKTLMGSTIPYVHNNNNSKGYNTIIMAPSHLVGVWERDIKKIPNSRVYVLDTYKDLIELEKKLRNKRKAENSYVIVTKEKAKLSYDERPAAIWNSRKRTFVCPDCGQTLYTIEKVKVPHMSKKISVRKPFTYDSMMKKNATNLTCMNSVIKYNSKTCRREEKICRSKLWGPMNRNDQDHKWFKIGSEGWLCKDHIPMATNTLLNKETLTKQETERLKQLLPQHNLYKAGEPYYSSYKGPKRYPISKYIRERMNKVFDYCIIDECHDAKGLSAQGMSAADLIRSAKKSILLTGTLLNGYSSGLYYLLWRINPAMMKKEGFNFNSDADFVRIYGVESKESSFRIDSAGRATNTRAGSSRTKELPGVSPLVFTKFLLENATFLSLSDMAEGLPNYTEIPVPITMSYDLTQNYNNLENEFMIYSRNGVGNKRAIGPFVRAMMNYVDSPHMAKPIINPENGETIYSPVVMQKQTREKEQELLRLTKEKLEKGEKVLVYYTDIHSSDIGKSLIQMFKDNNIKAYELSSKVSTDKREDWIDSHLAKDMQVMICNPKLVETGLTLLDFTTIIFFQTGYNLITMRQASRRSWRLSQKHDVEVYFLYYQNCIQEQALSLMATKLQASMAIEGKFSEEGLRAMNDNQDLLTQIANNVVQGIDGSINEDIFKSAAFVKKSGQDIRPHPVKPSLLKIKMNRLGEKTIFDNDYSLKREVIYMNDKYLRDPLKLFF